MALSLIVEDIATVPEAQRVLYVEKDGKHHLDVTGIEDTSGLKSALQKERDAVKEARRIQKEIEQRYEDRSGQGQNHDGQVRERR